MTTRPAWRTNYTPGRWLALTGPNTVVITTPPPASAAPVVNELWLGLLEVNSLDALMRYVAEVGLDEMPDLGAFHWDDDGLHGIARGRVQVVDTDNGEVVLTGEGTITWREEHLGRERNLGIALEDFDPAEVLQLPLVIGAATVSAVYLTTDPAALVRFPDNTEGPVQDDAPVVTAPPAATDVPRSAATPADEPSSEGRYDEAPQDENQHDEQSHEAQYDEQSHEAQYDEPQETPAAEAFDDEPMPEAAPSDEFLDDPDDIGPSSEELAAALSGAPAAPPVVPEVAEPPMGQPVSLSSPSGERSDPVVIPPTFGEVDDDGGTIFSTGLAATHKPAPPSEERPDPQVLAVPCTNNHPNAPGSRTCRICQYPVDSSNPRLIRRPTLAGVHTNRGDFADVVAGVIVGRAPDASKGPAGSHLMRVASPSNDISRSHVLITTQDWNVHVTDLHSTNGTTVLPNGEPPFTLRDGASVQVGIGTVLDLGDGVSLRIEPPRG